MAEGLNRVQLLGNLGSDPELKMTQGGQAVLKLRLACTEKYKDKNETWAERTEWVSVTLWGKRGEALAKFLAKGDRIFVEGSLRTSSFEKNGEKRYSTEVNATNVILCGGKGAGAGGEQRSTPAPASGGSSRGGRGTGGGRSTADDFGGAGGYGGGGDDEIPFVVDATIFGRWDRP
jgi:single-strand DNA-binding protein